MFQLRLRTLLIVVAISPPIISAFVFNAAYLHRRFVLSESAQIASPGYGTCGRCGLPWDHCEPHITSHEHVFSEGVGCFPLCEDCWRELKTPAARLPYYEALFKRWEKWVPASPERQQLVREAVARGG